jgi:hypothetical protein
MAFLDWIWVLLWIGCEDGGGRLDWKLRVGVGSWGLFVDAEKIPRPRADGVDHYYADGCTQCLGIWSFVFRSGIIFYV